MADGSSSPPLRFGLIADPQYTDADPQADRFYRNSLPKLQACVDDLNAHDLRFVLHLGDAIDRDFASFDRILPLFQRLRHPVLHVLGNHDFDVAPEAKPRVAAAFGLASTRYVRRDLLPGWRIIVLDGSDVSTFTHAPGTPPYQLAERLIETGRSNGLPQAQLWNGGLSREQLDWLDAELADTDTANERVLIACHFGVYPTDRHNLLNDADLLDVIDCHPCVNLYLNGHNHDGNHGLRNGVHYLTLRGMIETRDTTAYAVAELFRDRLVIHGRGREPSRNLPLRVP